MELVLQRRPTVKETTFGDLSIDGVFECHTLEDSVREIHGLSVDKWKIPGITAIPAGRYPLKMVESGRFGPDTFSVEHVPGFDSIRIHSGNDDADTEGCILVGRKIIESDDDGGNIGESRIALSQLKEKVGPLIKAGKPVFITVCTC